MNRRDPESPQMEPVQSPLLLKIAVVALAGVLLAACGGGAGGTPVLVTAREYVFEGIPDNLEAGEFTFTLDNEGGEVHELHLFKLADDVETVEALQGQSQDEAMDKLTTVDMAKADPGEQDSVDVDLRPGRYAAVCLILAGTRPGDGHSEHDMEQMEDMVFDPNADTHFSRGMFADFTVS